MYLTGVDRGDRVWSLVIPDSGVSSPCQWVNTTDVSVPDQDRSEKEEVGRNESSSPNNPVYGPPTVRDPSDWPPETRVIGSVPTTVSETPREGSGRPSEGDL